MCECVSVFVCACVCARARVRKVCVRCAVCARARVCVCVCACAAPRFLGCSHLLVQIAHLVVILLVGLDGLLEHRLRLRVELRHFLLRERLLLALLLRVVRVGQILDVVGVVEARRASCAHRLLLGNEGGGAWRARRCGRVERQVCEIVVHRLAHARCPLAHRAADRLRCILAKRNLAKIDLQVVEHFEADVGEVRGALDGLAVDGALKGNLDLQAVDGK